MRIYAVSHTARVRFTVTTAALALAVVAPRTARAQYSPYLLPETQNGTGVETSVVLGAAGLEDFSSNAFSTQSTLPDVQFGPGPSAMVSMGYRYLPWLSTGAALRYDYHPLTSSLQRATTAHGDSLVFGMYTRAYLGTAFGLRHFEPWVAVAFDPAATIWEAYTLPNSTVAFNVVSVALDASVGFDINVSRTIALGVMGDASWWFPIQRCASVTSAALIVPPTCGSSNLRSERGWFGGISARFTIGP